jgi:AcrR family transcriptional regulator
MSRAVPGPPRVTKRRAETRSRLLLAAAEVFSERGFGRATVEDVCDRAGFTRGAFYSNFASLDELFFALYAERSAEFISVAGAAVARTDRALPVKDLISRVLAALPISRESHVLNLEFAAHALRHPEVAAALADRKAELREALIPILRTGLGDRAATLSRKAFQDMSRAIIGIQEGMFLQELLEPGNRSLAALRRELITRVISGEPSG